MTTSEHTAPPLGIELASRGVDDVRAADPVARLLEDSWESRDDRASAREMLVEAGAAVLFLALALPLGLPAFIAGRVPGDIAVLLVVLYAIVARTIKFPIGAGYVVPSYLVLVPMLLLLPPETVPLLAAVGLTLGSTGRLLAHRGTAEDILFSVPDAWHAVGPATVLMLWGSTHGVTLAFVYVGALAAGCLVDLIASTVRESLAHQVMPQLQVRVIGVVWLVDACIAPLGLLIAQATRAAPARLLLLLPLMGLLMVVDRDRRARITDAQTRLSLIARERQRLQAAVQRLGDAFAARLDLQALIDVVLHGSIDAIDADAGQLTLESGGMPLVSQAAGARELAPLLMDVISASRSDRRPRQRDDEGVWALALPFTIEDGGLGALAVARRGRPFRDDEQALMLALVERAQIAAADILAHEALREQAMTDPLTRLGNRRRLADDLSENLLKATLDSPLVLMLFDLDGFKTYNDTFGHVAGDALLARLGRKLAAAVAPDGTAYRLGGDEFCVLLPARREELDGAVGAALGALEERGDTFTITASCGLVLLPHEAGTADYAVQLADERMYARKQGRPSGARQQAHDVLVHIMQTKNPALTAHSSGVSALAVRVAQRLGMTPEGIDQLARAAALHDIGKVGIPEAILSKPGELDPAEWEFIRQHTVLGERILSAAPALRPIAKIVRAHHERWDGRGYPDGLRGDQIPLAARIVAVCDAYLTIITDRCYRRARSPQAACDELRRESGGQFDPAVVEAFLDELGHGGAYGIGPPGSSNAALVSDVASHIRRLLEDAPL